MDVCQCLKRAEINKTNKLKNTFTVSQFRRRKSMFLYSSNFSLFLFTFLSSFFFHLILLPSFYILKLSKEDCIVYSKRNELQNTLIMIQQQAFLKPISLQKMNIALVINIRSDLRNQWLIRDLGPKSKEYFSLCLIFKEKAMSIVLCQVQICCGWTWRITNNSFEKERIIYGVRTQEIYDFFCYFIISSLVAQQQCINHFAFLGQRVVNLYLHQQC